MPSSARERIRMKTELIEILGGPDWSWDHRNVLFSEFGLPRMTGDPFGPTVADIITDADERTVADLYALVAEGETDDSDERFHADGLTNWEPEHVRVFISHSAQYKAFVSEVAKYLDAFGFHGFVAHDSMTVSQSWQRQIEQALRTMDAAVVILHPEVNSSAWCQQEIGWALGRGVPHFVLRMGADPDGFIAATQWASRPEARPEQIGALIIDWLIDVPALRSAILTGLLGALREVTSFDRAARILERVEAISGLSPDDLDTLGSIWAQNGQLTGRNPEAVLRRIHGAYGRPWPPDIDDVATEDPEFEPF